MKKTTFMLLAMVVSAFFLSSQLGREGFMDDDGGNGNGNEWKKTSNIPSYSFNNNTDIWDTNFTGKNGRIAGPHSGTTYLAGRDLDNPHSESVLNSDNPEHIISFDTYNLAGVDAEISFWYNYVNLDKNDYIRFELSYQQFPDWNNASHISFTADIFKKTQSGNFSSNDWEEFTYSIPSGNNYVNARLVVYQNGNEYLGFDSFELKPSTLTTKESIIEGFTYSPNPTKDKLYLNAKTELNKVEVYDILSKKVYSKTGKSLKMDLDLSTLKSGIYFAKVTSGNAQQTIKLIKN